MIDLIAAFILYISGLCDEEKFTGELNKQLQNDPKNEILFEMQRFDKKEDNLYKRRYEQFDMLEPLIKRDPEGFEMAFMCNLGDWFFAQCSSDYCGMNGFAYKISEMPSVEEYIKSFDFFMNLNLCTAFCTASDTAARKMRTNMPNDFTIIAKDGS